MLTVPKSLNSFFCNMDNHIRIHSHNMDSRIHIRNDTHSRKAWSHLLSDNKGITITCPTPYYVVIQILLLILFSLLDRKPFLLRLYR